MRHVTTIESKLEAIMLPNNKEELACVEKGKQRRLKKMGPINASDNCVGRA